MLDTMNTVASTNTLSQRLEQAIELHMKGVNGDAASVLQANRLLEGLRSEFPGNPLVEAFYGSSLILIARDKTKPMEQLKWSNQGLKILDSAVAASPQNLTVRLLRGKNAFQLPENHFRRTRTMIEDYTFIINQHIRGNTILSSEEYSQLWYELGEAYARIGRNQDAAATWRTLESQTKNMELQQRARQKLQSLEGKPAQETITESSPLSMLIEATRTIGNALVNWSDQGNSKGKQKKKTKSKEKKKKSERKKSLSRKTIKVREKSNRKG